MESIYPIFWDHVRRIWICWAMNARCKAHKPNNNSSYEQEMKKSFTMIFCNLRASALEKIRRTRRFYASLMRWEKYWMLRIQSWFVTNCASRLSRKTFYSKQETTRICDGMQQVVVHQEKVWSARKPNDGRSSHSRYKPGSMAIFEKGNSVTISALSQIHPVDITYDKRASSFYAPKLWNSLPEEIKSLTITSKLSGFPF